MSPAASISSACKAVWAVALVLTLGPTGCVTEEEILGGRGVAGAAGTAGAPAGATDDWSTDTCYEALARGADGDACVGSFGCQTVVRDCCRSSVTCADGRLSLVERCDACDCQTDDDCPFAFVCVASKCVDCPAQPRCAFPLAPVRRNGCLSCVAIDDCSNDADCDAGSVCYAGRDCPPGCFQDPSCCSGSICAAPGCGSAAELDCSIVGCELGDVCEVVDPRHSCACEGGQWVCATASGSSCTSP